MDATGYWMWNRRKLSERRPLSPQIPPISVGSSNSESWEEQAFAEDSAGHLGGCIWPPRSYSCSFCRREFRSAQALGGHMNVHRRDRARLKQSSSPTSEAIENSHHHHLNPCVPPIPICAPQLGHLVYNSNPTPNPNCGVEESPALSPSKVSAASTQENLSEHTSISPSHSSCVIRENLKESLFSTTRSPKASIPVGLFAIPELKLGRGNLSPREVGCRARSDTDEEEEEAAIGIKRRRINDSTSFFVSRSSDHDWPQDQAEVLKFSPRPVEELDLELRLGDPPKVK